MLVQPAARRIEQAYTVGRQGREVPLGGVTPTHFVHAWTPRPYFRQGCTELAEEPSLWVKPTGVLTR